ncbi:MAG TPA: LLM class F420-dependent oxidoreductase [Mycobacteriales bacterium]|jgi:probable F420-dependent oxidoreductase
MTGTLPALAVSLGLWQDRPPEEAFATARTADELGFGELWIGEMATYDAFALATAVGLATERISLTVGPLAVTVRDPMTIAVGAASVAAVTGRRVDVALGTSSPVVVEEWHGRDRARSVTALRESAAALRPLLAGARSDGDGSVVRSRGYQLRLPAPRSTVTVAAFGPAAIEVAARHGDRMVVSLVTVPAAAALAGRLASAARAADRPTPRLAAWVPVAVGGVEPAREQVRRMLVGYVAAPGYAEMVAQAGFGDVVAYAQSRPHPRDLLAAIPDELVDTMAVLGDEATVRDRLARYAAHVDEVVVLPCCTDDDPAGARTLRALADRPAGAEAVA